MMNKLPIKYEGRFFNKIKNFFYRLFKKDVIVEECNIDIKENKIETNIQESEIENMKKISNKEKAKDEIVDLIEKNPEVLKTLSLEQLKKIDSIYDEIIKENDRKINKLKREIA